jgi:hypothetical protein
MYLVIVPLTVLCNNGVYYRQYSTACKERAMPSAGRQCQDLAGAAMQEDDAGLGTALAGVKPDSGGPDGSHAVYSSCRHHCSYRPGNLQCSPRGWNSQLFSPHGREHRSMIFS